VDRIYQSQLLDAVAVIEVDSKEGIVNAVYKRERRCKHPNVQFTLTNTGVNPVCEQCGLVMEEQSVAMAGAMPLVSEP